MKIFIRNKRKEFCINETVPLHREKKKEKKRESTFASTTIPRLPISNCFYTFAKETSNSS